jgi:hypothetical protein|tara:strand:+ start:1076 stop:1357 length:282 start_codon:yes stop_codon:yes gene_type:complete
MPDEETTSPDKDDVIKFPIERLGLEEKVFYHCKACNHKITESMEKDEKSEKSKLLPLNLGGLMIYVCPNCYTLQLPEEVFKEILKKSTSNIIT